MTIVLIGNSYFGPKLAKQLSDFDKKNSYLFYDTNSRIIDKIKFALHVPFIDVVYSISGSIRAGGALKLALLFNKKIVQHFIGSDVLSAQKDFKKNNINKKLIQKSDYLCEVKWLKDELEDINIPSKVVPIMVYENFTNPKKIKNFSILTYIGKNKEKFYGIDDFIRLANDFEDIEFKIAGIDSYENLPNNIKCLGWTDLKKELQNSAVYIRNAKHDGLAFSAMEALAEGRYVAMNYHYPFCDYFSNYNELKNIIQNKWIEFRANSLDVNFNAVEFVKKEFSEKNVLRTIIEKVVK
jgi:glycosyltransferase involved in cell wall biosynthesis